MVRLVVFEDVWYRNLLPLVYWRACFELRCGYELLLDKIERTWPEVELHLYVRSDLADVVSERHDAPVNKTPDGPAVFVNGRLLRGLDVDQIKPNSYGVSGGSVVYVNADAETAGRLSAGVFLDGTQLSAAVAKLERVECKLGKHGLMEYPWDLVHANEDELVNDWKRSEGDVIDGEVCQGAYILNSSSVHVGKGTVIKPCAVLDAEDGPIYIGENVTISPNSTVQGPCYIGDGCLVQPTAMVREGTTLGPVCKVGGELECTIIHGYSNKQHTGFLGHAYVCEWVNLGAGCTNSDLKNTYGSVRVPVNGKEVDSGETFVGMMIGDHSKTGINTSFATGSVMGTCCNVFYSSYPEKFIPSFSWYTDKGLAKYDARRGIEVARKVMGRRKKDMTPALEKLFLSLPETAQAHEQTGA
jgi:UDP-N-acetylglucosamine diphosphorylase/glucosamine-1-phosphate N-acetyltransferase